MEHTIDATNAKLGRVASQAAALLLGKQTASFRKNRKEMISVKVENVQKLDLPEKKLLDKKYVTYTGYPGGLKKKTLGQLIDAKGKSEILWQAVYGMLPKNTLRAQLIKRLKISE